MFPGTGKGSQSVKVTFSHRFVRGASKVYKTLSMRFLFDCFMFSGFYLKKALMNVLRWDKMSYQKAKKDY